MAEKRIESGGVLQKSWSSSQVVCVLAEKRNGPGKGRDICPGIDTAHGKRSARIVHQGDSVRTICDRNPRRLYAIDLEGCGQNSGGGMMLSLTGVRVYLAMGHTDMRMSINGLSVLVSARLKQNPLSGHLYAFTNRKQTLIKILYWDRNGFCLWQKRLEKDRFKWPTSEKEGLGIGSRELLWLLDGLDIRTVRAHKSLEYSAVC